MRKSQLRWRMFLLSLQRVPHDPEARTKVIRILFLLLYYVGYTLFLRREYKEVGWQGYFLSIFLLLLGFLGAVFISRSNRRADTLTLKLSAHPKIEAGDLDLQAHRQQLADELIRIAALVDRSATEYLHIIVRSSEVQSGVARQHTLTATRPAQLWQGFSPDEQSLLHSPEGAWPQQVVLRTTSHSESVRVLRWVIGIDPVLPPIALAEQELKSTFALTANPGLAQGSACIQPWDIRPAQNEAQSALTQCIAESFRRKICEPEDEAERDLFLRDAQRQTPVVIGSKPIEDIDLDELQRMTGIALQRVQALSAVIDYLNSDATGSFSLRTAEEAQTITA